ncbi:glycosyltransferase 87 family protein [Tundrisphaera sp. TA3]|uniref:glycosyltransferase 87 family protein n=1 Tax=Tundrisphaera sp. TA3 TaxID=3435775 RepID=UPI003EB8EE6C
MPAFRVDRPDGLTGELPSRVRTLGTVLGLCLIVAWAAWWAGNLRRDAMTLGGSTWVPPLTFLAGDFKVHIDHVARLQAAGVDPYRRADDWVCALYPYPPMIARVFAWVAWFPKDTAAAIWQAALAGCYVVGGVAAWRARRRLGSAEIPAPLVVAAVLFGTPALFAMERGQSDPMVIPILIASAWLLGRRGNWAEVAAGAILGATAWLKYYPGIAVVAPLALGRWRAVAAFVVVVAAIGVVDRDGFARSVRNGRATAVVMADKVRFVHPTKHSIVESWPAIGVVHRSKVLRKLPGAVAALILLAPAVVVVGRRFARAAGPGPLTLPFLLWLVAAATFAMPYSLDYNLVPLTLAALALWDRRDGWAIHAAMGLLLLYWQPFALPIGGPVLLAIKLSGLYAAGASLCRRAGRAAPANRPVGARLVGAGRVGYAR